MRWQLAAMAGLIGLVAPVVSAEEKVFRNVSVIAMDGSTVKPNRAVVISDDVIAGIVPDEDFKGQPGTVEIDGTGLFLTPGLIDAHVHHYAPVPYINYIANGVTTVLGLGQREDGLDLLDFRDEIRAGNVVGPRIYTSDKTIGAHIDFEDPDEARAYVREVEANGFDYLKVYNDIPKDVFDAVVDEARQHGLSVFGHIPRRFPADYSLTHGLNVVAHAEEFYFACFGGPADDALPEFDGSDLPDLDGIDPYVQLMVDNDVALIPNLVFTFTTMRFWDDEEAALADPEVEFWPPVAEEAWRTTNGARRDMIGKRMLRERIKYGFIHEFTRRAHEAGVLIVTGTDAPERGVMSGLAVHGEMRELVKAGLSFEEALAAATSNGGKLIERFVDETARVGQIAVGFEADLVLVRANPLEDIRHMKAIEGVMVDGVWYDRAALDRLRADAKASFTEE